MSSMVNTIGASLLLLVTIATIDAGSDSANDVSGLVDEDNAGKQKENALHGTITKNLASALVWLQTHQPNSANNGDTYHQLLRRTSNLPIPSGSESYFHPAGQTTPFFNHVQKRHCWDVSDVCCMWNVC